MSKPTFSSRLAIRDRPVDAYSLMDQKWRSLLFLHWEYPVEEIQKTLPPGLSVDLYDGKAYIGLVNFKMKDIRLKIGLPFPGLSDFFEMNVRTYVYDEAGMPGVWFYSLDANSRIAVQMASGFFHLPYRYAWIESEKSPENRVSFRCEREGKREAPEFLYLPQGEKRLADLNSLEFFLIERYALFVDKEKELRSGRIHHSPYFLQDAEVFRWDAKAFEWNGFTQPNRSPDHVCFSPGIDVDVFSLKKAPRC